MHYYCLLGSSPDLSLAELQTVLSRLAESALITPIIPHLVMITLDHTQPTQLLGILGGTVKVYAALQGNLTADLLAGGYTTFAINPLSVATAPSASTIKTEAATLGLHTRYRLLKSPYDSVGILKDTQEYLVLDQAEGLLTLKTVAVQDIHHWTMKDYGRPASSPRAGMLPPKVSRMLVNLALPEQISPATTVYDPFCGVGTILIEALDVGAGCIGTDISPKALAAAAENSNWFQTTYHPPGRFALFPHNILTPVPKIPSGTVDAVVAEGYLGPPHLTSQQIPDYVKGLTKFYTGVVKHLRPLLKPHGRLVLCIPAYAVAGSVKTLKGLVDSCEKLGYTPLGEPLWYYRPQAIIRRHILVWQKA